MEPEPPHHEQVKCVVVGDTAVGKTRLVCARACDKAVSLSQLIATHVPTVWAIDQYRMYKDVLERSREEVDGVSVSLRLWDTFGDHDKDRRFAYGRSDVVLLCFAVDSPASLRNCAGVWFPEIRRFCPHTPVLLVGCKNDLRHMYRDETYLRALKTRAPLVKAPRKQDLVMPDEGRALAEQIGVYYYESSVLTGFGVGEVFENAVRAALLARRQRFWMTNLKRVQRPLPQAPFLPPAPREPTVTVPPSRHLDNLASLLTLAYHADLEIVCGSSTFRAHRCMLAAACGAFLHLLSDAAPARAASAPPCLLMSPDAEAQDKDTPKPERWTSGMLAADGDGWRHPAFRDVREHRSERGALVVVEMSTLVTERALAGVLGFVYGGRLDLSEDEAESADMGLLLEVRSAAELLALPELAALLSDAPPDEEAIRRQRSLLTSRAGAALPRLFPDIDFELDDGRERAHRALLVACCEPLRAMLAGHFRESGARVVALPGVKASTFRRLREYSCADTVRPLRMHAEAADEWTALLALADRLCLPRLTALASARVVEALRAAAAAPAAALALRLLEPAKLHNAHALAEWCAWRLCGAYEHACRARELRGLHPDNREYLREHRYPPVWYLKEFDCYTRCAAEREREARAAGTAPPPVAAPPHHLGCLCFSGKSRRESDGTPDAPERSALLPAHSTTPAAAR